MKNTTSANVWSFDPEAITVNGRTFPAAYSLAKSGDVYVFASVQEAADAAAVPVRIHISAAMPMHAQAVAAAEAARKEAKASKPAVEPAPVDKPAGENRVPYAPPAESRTFSLNGRGSAFFSFATAGMLAWVTHRFFCRFSVKTTLLDRRCVSFYNDSV